MSQQHGYSTHGYKAERSRRLPENDKDRVAMGNAVVAVVVAWSQKSAVVIGTENEILDTGAE